MTGRRDGRRNLQRAIGEPDALGHVDFIEVAVGGAADWGAAAAARDGGDGGAANGSQARIGGKATAAVAGAEVPAQRAKGWAIKEARQS